MAPLEELDNGGDSGELEMLKELNAIAMSYNNQTPGDSEMDHAGGKLQAADEIQDVVADGAVDIRGRPSIKSRTGNWKACWLIFGNLVYCSPDFS
jgi:peptide/histidine transporter 3/4